MSSINDILKNTLVAMGGTITPACNLNIAMHYKEPQRHYHTVQHIEECLVCLDEFKSLARSLEEVRMALLMHDLIYDPRKKNNEKLSADYTQKLMTDVGVNAQSCVRVYKHIMATVTHSFVDDSDTCLVMDIDMLILAAELSRLEEYENQIRKEYSHVPGFIYRVKRKMVLRNFLK